MLRGSAFLAEVVAQSKTSLRPVGEMTEFYVRWISLGLSQMIMQQLA